MAGKKMTSPSVPAPKGAGKGGAKIMGGKPSKGEKR
jgi:hypothetical protein